MIQELHRMEGNQVNLHHFPIRGGNQSSSSEGREIMMDLAEPSDLVVLEQELE